MTITASPAFLALEDGVSASITFTSTYTAAKTIKFYGVCQGNDSPARSTNQGGKEILQESMLAANIDGGAWAALGFPGSFPLLFSDLSGAGIQSFSITSTATVTVGLKLTVATDASTAGNVSWGVRWLYEP